jgi:hypothetical protein
MSMEGTPREEWIWAQVEDFRHPNHPEWDLIQWDLEEELTKGPRKISTLVQTEPEEFWYMKSKDAPGLAHLPPIVVLFRIDREPTPEEPGLIVGIEAWDDEDLMTDLTRRLQGRPTF